MSAPASVVMLNGYTACGKTTVAKQIRGCLGVHGVPCVLVQTNAIRNQRSDRGDLVMSAAYFLSDTHRNLVYAEVLEEMKSQLASLRIPILDGTFNKRHWRIGVYRAASELGAKVYVVRCECDGEEIVRKRLRKRVLTFEDPHFVDLDRTRRFSAEELEGYVEESFRIYRTIRDFSDEVSAWEVEQFGLRIGVVDTRTSRVRTNFLSSSGCSLMEAVEMAVEEKEGGCTCGTGKLASGERVSGRIAG